LRKKSFIGESYFPSTKHTQNPIILMSNMGNIQKSVLICSDFKVEKCGKTCQQFEWQAFSEQEKQFLLWSGI